MGKNLKANYLDQKKKIILINTLGLENTEGTSVQVLFFVL
ncbi:hypothetical protein AJ85_04880 [Alkalihalobacillus alcalophilus ATCC 27647 = CGMCC 1.3604]|uniref:Uncharacterized protein n=1 Tax=Alkalihalobacillus alcalophilus ATCC 27647 = CGMCC 1.3604 TaxID=1218173 RepID=A0A4S4JVY3_ALKAL|nr:hypothetical protein AJ85_04880 [Alkalihalobacillus alcalophilus ATCC 27647 = CGMCC 1.3604]